MNDDFSKYNLVGCGNTDAIYEVQRVIDNKFGFPIKPEWLHELLPIDKPIYVSVGQNEDAAEAEKEALSKMPTNLNDISHVIHFLWINNSFQSFESILEMEDKALKEIKQRVEKRFHFIGPTGFAPDDCLENEYKITLIAISK